MSNIWGILAKKLTAANDTVSLNNGYINMEFDLITNESHSWTSDVTLHPVEDGQAISDHIQRKPDTLDISGIISNASMRRWRGSFIEKLKNILNPESDVQKAFDKLHQLMDDRQSLTVYTRYRNYPEMVLTHLSIPRKKEDGDAIEFTAKFTHIRRVSTLIVNAKDAGINPKQSDSPATARKAAKTKKMGAAQPTDATDIIGKSSAATELKKNPLNIDDWQFNDA